VVLRQVRPNAGVESWYRRKLDKMVKELNDSVTYWVKADYNKSGLAQDASPVRALQSAFRKLAKRWTKRFDDMADKLAAKFADATMVNSDVSLSTAFKDIGVTVQFKMTEPMNNALQAVIAENVNLIKSIPEQYLTQVETLVMQSAGRGRDLGYLADELQKRYGITKRRAALIARDQNNKATSVMQVARQTSLGITEGIWHHSHAGKVPRPSHVRASGTKFDLSKGLLLDGEWLLPGEAINCRCTWSAVIPGLD